MTALVYLLMCIIYFICVGLDIIMFFLQVRLLFTWRNIQWLRPFDTAGTPIVDMVTAQLPRFTKTSKPLSEKGKLIIALLMTATLRMTFGLFINLK
ncbi:hypothetical protein SMSP2_01277 [Limihaloglobus sulfuriphilus]|uniref:YGGT family protein n=1 Tax=Limihaloglobus sulfuriphilus TaxID=1851148 RepID=A0A1Q2ME46_9BACT|nr:hypothetical protein [Limihaloglobus sulfuriphilus]AQQ70914.1 hypothetical protein SMSP2_01277 [Limihaloglobus sulfuriphilus]